MNPAFTLWFAGAGPTREQVAKALATAGVRVEPGGALSSGEGLGLTGPEDGRVQLAGVTMQDEDLDGAAYFDLDRRELDGAAAFRLALLEPAPADRMAGVRALARLVPGLAAIDGCLGLGWVPAKSAMGADYARAVIGQWLDGGAFPALGLTSLSETRDGGFVSRGLSAICGQELAVAADAAVLPADRARIAIRLIDFLVEHGPVTAREVIEIDGFGRFEVSPGAEGKKINLRRSPIA